MEFKKIPREELLKWRWYLGRGRNANVAMWTGKVFLTVGARFERMEIKSELYHSSEYGTFQPFMLIDEGRVVPCGQKGWASHYGRQLIVDGEDLHKKVDVPQFRKKYQLDLENGRKIRMTKRRDEKA